VLKVHRILSRALKIAHRRRMIVENVATLVDPPSVNETEANPFTIDEAKAFLKAAAKRPTFMRWIVGVGMGLRQREALGFRWPHVDLEGELFHPQWQLQRLTWRHGCKDPHACGSEHKTQQDEMRAAAGDERQEHKAVFTRPDGRPLDPRADWEEF